MKHFSFIPILLAIALLDACAPKAAPMDPALVFADVEKSLKAAYVYPLPPEGLVQGYRAAGQAIGAGPTESRESLVAVLLSQDADLQRANVYKALDAFLKTLPGGKNRFIKPEALKWSKDPERSAGVGLVIQETAPGKFFVLDTLEGSAAHREAVRTGVYLKAVDGEAVDTMDQAEAIGRIKGPPDTEVQLDFEYGKHSLVRGQVVFRNVLNAPWDTADGGKIEYIALRSTLPPGGGFAGTANQLKELLIPMKTRRAVILDLRKLHLGDIEESFRVADLFVKDAPLGSVRSRAAGGDKSFTADTDQVYTGPVYVIVGKHSSPQAQTVAMAMKISPNVKLVGAATDGAAYLSSSKEIAGGIELEITSGFVQDATGRPFYETGLAVDFPVADILPPRPPLKQPDQADPAQAKLAELLQAK